MERAAGIGVASRGRHGKDGGLIVFSDGAGRETTGDGRSASTGAVGVGVAIPGEGAGKTN